MSQIATSNTRGDIRTQGGGTLVDVERRECAIILGAFFLKRAELSVSFF